MSQQKQFKINDLQKHTSSKQNRLTHVNQMMDFISQKRNQYLKQLQTFTPYDKTQNLHYLKSNSNARQEMTTQMKRLMKEEYLARGSIPEFQVQLSTQNRDKNQFNGHGQRFKMPEKHSRSKKIPKAQTQKLQNKQYEFRYKTSPTQQQTTLKQSPFNHYSVEKCSKKKHYNQNNLEMFKQIVSQIRKNGKNNQILEKWFFSLSHFNAFFKKVQRVIGICLLRIGKMVQKLYYQSLYDIDVSYNYFYIILSGKIKIKGHEGMHKICQTGETLLEQLILSRQQFPRSLEGAKVLNQCWLLQIDMKEYYRLGKQLLKFGFKQGYLQVETIIKRNMITKNWLRNKYKLQFNS